MNSRYEIIDMLTQDEDGVAYLAHDKEAGMDVVLRRFFPNGRDGGGLDPNDMAAYERTVTKLIALSHPALRKVLDGGTDPLDNLPFLVTESLGGRPLLHRLQEGAFDGASSKMILKMAIESSLALSEIFGVEAVWVETDTRGIMTHPERDDREVTFRISPMRWLGGEPSREGLGSLLQLGEEITGWGSRIISGEAGDGLGAWVQALRKQTNRWSLQQALAELMEPGSSSQLQETRPVKSQGTPVIRPPGVPSRASNRSSSVPTTTTPPVQSTTPVAATSAVVDSEPEEIPPHPLEAAKQAALAHAAQAEASAKVLAETPKSSNWPWLAGAACGLLFVGYGTWRLNRSLGLDDSGQSAVVENGNQQDDEPNDPDPGSNAGPDAGPTLQVVPMTQQVPTPDPRDEPLNARLIEIGKELHGKVGQEVELEPMKILAYNNTTGVVEFGTVSDPNAVCGVLSNAPERQQGIRKVMKSLAGGDLLVALKGKVVKMENDRIAIEILSNENLLVDGAAVPTPGDNTPPKPTPPTPPNPGTVVDPNIDARLMAIGKDLHHKIGQEVEIEPFKAMAFENGLLEFGSQKTSNTICGWVQITEANPRTSLKNRLQKFVNDGTMVSLKGKVVKLPSGRIAIHINMGHNANAVKTPKPPSKPAPPKPDPSKPKVDPKVNALVLDTGKSLRKQIGQVVGLEPMQVVAYENGYVEFGTERGPNAICGWIDFTPSNQKNSLQNRMRTFASKKTWVMLNGKVLETRHGRIAIQIVTPHNALDVDPKNPAASIPRQPKLKPQPQPKPQPNPPNAQGNIASQDLAVRALAKVLSQRVGTQAKIGPLKVVSYDGKTLEFTNKEKDKAVCGVMAPQGQREQGTNALLTKLHKDGATISLKGKVVKLPGGRIAIEILGQKSIELQK